jgi:hypothetical protein
MRSLYGFFQKSKSGEGETDLLVLFLIFYKKNNNDFNVLS